MLIKLLMVNGLMLVFHLLHNFKVVTISFLPFLIVSHSVRLNFLVVLFDLVGSILAGHIGFDLHAKLSLRLISVFVELIVLLICHVPSLAIGLHELFIIRHLTNEGASAFLSLNSHTLHKQGFPILELADNLFQTLIILANDLCLNDGRLIFCFRGLYYCLRMHFNFILVKLKNV